MLIFYFLLYLLTIFLLQIYIYLIVSCSCSCSCVCDAAEGDEYMEDGMVLHNLGSSAAPTTTSSSSSDIAELVAYRITCSTPNRFSFENSYGVVKFDEALQIPVLLKCFPSLLASDETPFATFTVDYAHCVDSYFDFEPKFFWDTYILDKYLRKTVASKAVGCEDRGQVEAELLLSDPTKALLVYDGLSQLGPEASQGLGGDASAGGDTGFEDSSDSFSGGGEGGGGAEPALGLELPPAPRASVYPKCLFFLEGDDPMESFIRLGNTSPFPVIYRVTPSLPKKFILPQKNGVLEANSAVNISVKLKSFPPSPPADDSLAKFSVEFVMYDDNYFTMDPVLFWREQGDVYLRKVVLSRAVRWEGREGVEARKRSLSMAEVPVEYDGYQPMETAPPPAPAPAAAAARRQSNEPEAAEARLSRGAAPPSESDAGRERRQGMGVLLAELSTALDGGGLALKQVEAPAPSPAPSPPPAAEDSSLRLPDVGDVMDDVSYGSSDPGGADEAAAAVEAELAAVEAELAAEAEAKAAADVLKAAAAVEAAAVVEAKAKAKRAADVLTAAQAAAAAAAVAAPPRTQPTQRRVSWVRAPELLRVSPSLLHFRGKAGYMWMYGVYMCRFIYMQLTDVLLMLLCCRGGCRDVLLAVAAQHGTGAPRVQGAAQPAGPVLRAARGGRAGGGLQGVRGHRPKGRPYRGLSPLPARPG
jgi:hypothetical protein